MKKGFPNRHQSENIRKNNSIFQKMIIMIMKKFNVVCSILDN